MRRRAGLWSKFWLIQIRSRVAPQAWRLCHTKLQFSLRLHPAAATFVTRCKKKRRTKQRRKLGAAAPSWFSYSEKKWRMNDNNTKHSQGEHQPAWWPGKVTIGLIGSPSRYMSEIFRIVDRCRCWRTPALTRIDVSPSKTDKGRTNNQVCVHFFTFLFVRWPSSTHSLHFIFLHCPLCSFFWFNRVDPLDNSLKTAFLLSSCSFLSSFLPFFHLFLTFIVGHLVIFQCSCRKSLLWFSPGRLRPPRPTRGQWILSPARLGRSPQSPSWGTGPCWFLPVRWPESPGLPSPDAGPPIDSGLPTMGFPDMQSSRGSCMGR